MCGDSMQCVRTLDDLDSLNILYDKRWDQEKPRLLMHSLHAYPAKFPPFLASEAFEYATEEGVNVQIAADIFSGCGTTALESKVRGISFWGCDINPVAVLIARTKVADYNLDSIKYLYRKIIEQFSKERNKKELLYNNASDRMKYWFDEDTYDTTSNYTINSAAKMAGLLYEVNIKGYTFSGKTIKIYAPGAGRYCTNTTCRIDMTAHDWVPLKSTFAGVFDTRHEENGIQNRYLKNFDSIQVELFSLDSVPSDAKCKIDFSK